MPVYKYRIVRSRYWECRGYILADSKGDAEKLLAQREKDGDIENAMKLVDEGLLIEATPNHGGKRDCNHYLNPKSKGQP